MTVFICGNSHVGALKRGLKELGADAPRGIEVFALGSAVIELASFSRREGLSVVLTDEEYAANLKHFAGADALTSDHYWGFCMGTHTTRLFRDQTWATTVPSAICQAGERPMSSGMLDTIIADELRNVLAFFAQMKLAGIDFFVVAAPPPRADHPCFEDGVRPETVLHIDHQLRHTFAAKLADQNITFVTPPPEVITPEGFLKPEFEVGIKASGKVDRHHANSAYGAIMMQRIAGQIGIC